jgi:hypothetical protein
MIVTALLLAADLASVAKPGLDAISGEAISAHVRFLADDALEGRGTGSRGHTVAARYLATQLQAMGFQPAGEKGGYFQTVPLIGATLEPSNCAVELDGRALVFGKEMLVGPRAGSAHDDVEGEVVFAGYGVSAPELGYDDVPADLKGKIALVLYGAPDFKDAAARAVYSDSVEKAKRLAARGAVGVITVFTPEMAKHLPFPFFARQAPFERMWWLDGDRVGRGSVLPAALLPVDALKTVFAKAKRDPDAIIADGRAGKLKPFPLGLRAHLRATAKLRRFTSENVVAILHGDKGPSTKESVLMSAHVDHLGIGPALGGGGDTIYNGAGDNAVGCALVLEQARAFASLRTRLPRNIIALFVTGEEKGLVGSDYFAAHPTAAVPLASVVANVNSDGGEWRWEAHDFVVLGVEHSTLAKSVATAARLLGLAISPDPEPEQVFFIRSDQYSFVRRGIPAIFPNVGWKDAKGSIETNKALDEWWTKNRYHQPSDEWEPSWNPAFLAADARARFLMTLAIALDSERPRWNPGDVFEKMFAQH